MDAVALAVVYLAIIKRVGALMESGRGIGVTTLREHGLTEGKVALWSSLVFGAVHLTNALGHGAQAVPQALAVSFAGYFFYLTRRVSGGLLVPAVLHGLFDFSILSSTVIDDRGYAGGLAAILAYPLVAVILVVRRHRIEPPRTAPGPQLAAAGTASAHDTA